MLHSIFTHQARIGSYNKLIIFEEYSRTLASMKAGREMPNMAFLFDLIQFYLPHEIGVFSPYEPQDLFTRYKLAP